MSSIRLFRLLKEHWHTYRMDDRCYAFTQWRTFTAMRSLLEERHARRVLEIGCGRFRALVTLLAAFGYEAVGVDTVYMGWGPICWRLLGAYRVDGPMGCAKEFVMAGWRERRFISHLSFAAGVDLAAKPTLVRADTKALPFADGSFDAVISHGVLEHVDDVPKAVREMARVLGKGGLTYHYIHLFSSLSGGHHSSWADPERVNDPPKVPPWDHLRGRTVPLAVYLNGLRRSDYVTAFEDVFGAVKVIDVPERGARRFLTPEIRAQIASYTEQELLTQTLEVVAEK